MKYTDQEVIDAIKVLRQKYGVVGLDGKYMLAEDVDGDLRIAPMGLFDKMLWKAGGVNANNFVKIKELTQKVINES